MPAASSRTRGGPGRRVDHERHGGRRISRRCRARIAHLSGLAVRCRRRALSGTVAATPLGPGRWSSRSGANGPHRVRAAELVTLLVEVQQQGPAEARPARPARPASMLSSTSSSRTTSRSTRPRCRCGHRPGSYQILGPSCLSVPRAVGQDLPGSCAQPASRPSAPRSGAPDLSAEVDVPAALAGRSSSTGARVGNSWTGRRTDGPCSAPS